MKTLFIDSSKEKLTVAIANSNKLILVSNVNSYYKHSNFLMKEIINVLNRSNLTIDDIDNIVVLNGPGSFTGVRVGVTVAKTLAWALNKKIYTLTTLEALSLQDNSQNIISVIKDKENSGYIGVYFDNLKEENYYFIQDFKKLINDRKFTLVCYEKNEFINNLHDELKKNNDVTVKIIDDYDYLKVITKALNGSPVNPHMAKPIYLKKIDAEKNKNCD